MKQPAKPWILTVVDLAAEMKTCYEIIVMWANMLHNKSS